MSFRGASKTGCFSSSLQGRDACVTRVAERATPEHERWRQPARNYERGSNKHAFPAKRPPKRYFLIAAVPWGTCTRKFQAGRPPRRGSPSAPHAKFAPCLSVTPPAPSAPHQKPPVAPRNTGRPEDAASNLHQSTRAHRPRAAAAPTHRTRHIQNPPVDPRTTGRAQLRPNPNS